MLRPLLLPLPSLVVCVYVVVSMGDLCSNLAGSKKMNSEQRTRARKELQGPRPAPLKISKDSHKIHKPPQQTSQPVIIYTQSPQIIHIEAQNFMNLVQRLTGSTSSSAHDNITVADDDLYRTKSEARVQDDLGNNKAMASTDESGITCREIAEGKLDHSVKGFPPLSPALNFLSPSSLLRMSPNIFQDMPLFTPSFETFMYSPAQFYRLEEAIFTPKGT